jgi:hypothetical protein
MRAIETLAPELHDKRPAKKQQYLLHNKQSASSKIQKKRKKERKKGYGSNAKRNSEKNAKKETTVVDAMLSKP